MNFLLPFLNVKVLGGLAVFITLGLLIKIYHFDPISDLEKEVESKNNQVLILDANISNLIVDKKLEYNKHKDAILIKEQQHIQEVLDITIKEQDYEEKNFSTIIGKHTYTF